MADMQAGSTSCATIISTLLLGCLLMEGVGC